jgi:hypothetical protein
MDDVFRSLKGKDIQPILPVLTKLSDNPLLVFPWDPEYNLFKKGEIPSPLNLGRPSQPDENTTRLLMKKGHWLPYCRIL